MISGLVDHRKVRRVVRLVTFIVDPPATGGVARSGSMVRASSCACALLVSISTGTGKKPGSPEILGAVAEGAAHGFDHVVPLLHRTFAPELRRKGLEDVQHLDERRAAARRGRHREDLIAAKGALHRIALDGFVLAQIVIANRAVVRGHVAIDEMRGLAFVELAPAVLLNARDGRRQFRLLHQFALLQRTVRTVQEDLRAVRKLLHHRSLQREDQFHALRGREAVFRQPARGFEHRLPRQFAEAGVRHRHPGHRAGHGRSLVADGRVQPAGEHAGMRGRGRGLLVIEGAHRAVRPCGPACIRRRRDCPLRDARRPARKPRRPPHPPHCRPCAGCPVRLARRSHWRWRSWPSAHARAGSPWAAAALSSRPLCETSCASRGLRKARMIAAAEQTRRRERSHTLCYHDWYDTRCFGYLAKNELRHRTAMRPMRCRVVASRTGPSLSGLRRGS